MSKEAVIRTYRGIKNVVRTYPFFYTLALLIVCLSEKAMSVRCGEIIELLAFTSLPSTFLCWKLSRIIGLCFWYRLQCVLMSLPLLIPICRTLYPEYDGIVLLVVIAILSVSLINRWMMNHKDWKVKRKKSTSKIGETA